MGIPAPDPREHGLVSVTRHFQEDLPGSVSLSKDISQMVFLVPDAREWPSPSLTPATAHNGDLLGQ